MVGGEMGMRVRERRPRGRRVEQEERQGEWQWTPKPVERPIEIRAATLRPLSEERFRAVLMEAVRVCADALHSRIEGGAVQTPEEAVAFFRDCIHRRLGGG